MILEKAQCAFRVDKSTSLLYWNNPHFQINWIDALSLALTINHVTHIPKEWIKLLLRISDGLGMVGIKFPINSAKYFNLTTTNAIPFYRVIKQSCAPSYSLANGIAETISWLRINGSILNN